MLAELKTVLTEVPVGSNPSAYREAILERNVLDKSTDSTRKESLRRLRELYALDGGTPLFAMLRKLHSIDPTSLPLLALQVTWARDPLFRATTAPVLAASEGNRVETTRLAQSLEATYGAQYSALSRNQTARHAASSWTQAGYLFGRAKKTRMRTEPTPASVAMALAIGNVAGYFGTAVFSNPWCQLLDIGADRARRLGQDAHKVGLLNLRAIGDVVELSFPLFADIQGFTS